MFSVIFSSSFSLSLSLTAYLSQCQVYTGHLQFRSSANYNKPNERTSLTVNWLQHGVIIILLFNTFSLSLSLSLVLWVTHLIIHISNIMVYVHIILYCLCSQSKVAAICANRKGIVSEMYYILCE